MRLRDGGHSISIKESSMNTVSKNCQSCGMPLSRDEKGGGTNADGSKSTMFCSNCYANGKFVFPDITVAGMKELVKGN